MSRQCHSRCVLISAQQHRFHLSFSYLLLCYFITFYFIILLWQLMARYCFIRWKMKWLWHYLYLSMWWPYSSRMRIYINSNVWIYLTLQSSSANHLHGRCHVQCNASSLSVASIVQYGECKFRFRFTAAYNSNLFCSILFVVVVHAGCDKQNHWCVVVCVVNCMVENYECCLPTCIWWGTRRNITIRFGMQNLECFGYPTV